MHILLLIPGEGVGEGQLGKMTFGWAYSSRESQTTICKNNKKAEITTRTEI